MPLSLNTQNVYIKRNSAFCANSQSEKFAAEGKNLLMINKYDEAISRFKDSLSADETNSQAYFDMARAYTYKKDYPNAIKSYESYLKRNPQDIEAMTMQGECYKNTGAYKQAQEAFNKALAINPKYDYAKRNLLETQNYERFAYDPVGSFQQREKQAKDNLSKALKYAYDYFPKGYLEPIKDVKITFDKTSSLGGRANIAQYEHAKQKISITDDFVWAAPEVVGAYLIHECVHARDNDPYTSVREEQDAFETATKFWLKNSQGIEDPELNFAAELYSKSAKDLADRVEEIYKARDPQIAMTSPNHPPGTNAATGLNSMSSSVPIRKYDVIA